MRNLLYTLLIGLVVISCNKDEEYGSAPLALSQEVELSTEMSDDAIYDLVDSILNGTYSESKLGNANITGKGNDYVKVVLFSDATSKYLILNDETNDDLCIGEDGAFEMFFDNSANDGSELTVEAPEGTVRLTLRGNFAGFFSAGLNSIKQTNTTTNVAVSMNFTDANTVSF